MKYLFDASSIYSIALAADPIKLVQRYTCILALYETGNILITETRVRKTIGEVEQKELLWFMLRAFNLMSFIGLRGEEEAIMAVAMRYGMSFYDASYVYAAKKASATLVTEDGKIGKRVGDYIKVISAKDLHV